MLIGAALLTTMILWMMKQQHTAAVIEKKAEHYISNGKLVSLALLVFFSVLREGIESVIFLGALNISSGSSLTGALFGILTAIVLGFLIFTGSRKISLKFFFRQQIYFLYFSLPVLWPTAYMNFRRHFYCLY